MKLIIEVTKDDIENGIRHNSYCCPIALAVCRALNVPSESEYVDVQFDEMFIKFYDVEVPNLDHWITSFDEEELVFPFSFEMNLVEKS